MPNRNRFDDDRRDDDREVYQSRQQGYSPGQMSQFDDSDDRDQMGSAGTGNDRWSQGTGRYNRETAGYQTGQYSREANQARSSQPYRDRGEYVYSRGRFAADDNYAPRDENFGGRSYVGHYSGIDSELGSTDYTEGYGQRGDWRGSNRRSSYARGDYPYGATFARGKHPRQDYAQSGTMSSPDEFHSWREYGESRGFLDKAGDEIASWFGDEDAARRREMDHRGRGPSGYTRSDERICEDANECLMHDRMVDASHIKVGVKDGEITLDGIVTHRQAKRRAEDLVHDLSGVKHVQNNLRVSSDTAGTATGTATQAMDSSRPATTRSS